MVERRKLTLDRDGFERAMEGQREKARAKSAFEGGRREEAALDAPTTERAGAATRPATVFGGYDTTALEDAGRSRCSTTRQQPVDALDDGRSTASWRSRETPFYLEAGGQVSDVGTIATAPAARRASRAWSRVGPAGRALHARRGRRAARSPRATS